MIVADSTQVFLVKRTTLILQKYIQPVHQIQKVSALYLETKIFVTIRNTNIPNKKFLISFRCLVSCSPTQRLF